MLLTETLYCFYGPAGVLLDVLSFYAWNVSANNSESLGHKDLGLGQIVVMLVFYNISFSCLLLLDGFQFIFLLRDSENDL